ncbi:MAG: protein kinase [Verrucomicrobiae bacterium]|nr:protein kinase [Verrucomicrobiae bacterium]
MNSCPTCKKEIPDGAPESVCPSCLLDETADFANPTTIDQVPAESLGQIGNFKLKAEIARGGMGVVYRAYQEDLNRMVAIKMIRGGRFADDREQKRFLAEAEAAANLRHPGIVAIHQVGEENGNHYFSMDFVEGGDLETWLGGRPMEDMKAAHLIKEISRAVAYAHGEGIIHRDLKPQNILMDADGKPHVTDFGIAKRIDGDSQLTVTGAVMGSPSYMSPEQAAGQTSNIAVTSDIYSLGAILYALLTGRPPFQAATPMKTLEQVTSREPVPPKTLNPSISDDLNTICLKCLNKSPEARYNSADELIAELNRFCEGKPILARPIGRTETALKWVRRNPLVSILYATIGIVALVGFLSVLWQLQKTKAALDTARELQRAEISARAPRHSPKLVLQQNSETLSVAFAPNGSDLLTASADGYWRLFDGSDGELLRELKGHEGMVADAEFSGDGSRILTYSFDSQTHLPHLNPNGETVLTDSSHAYGDQSARLWDPATGANLQTFTTATQMTSAKLSPDGKWIATTDWDGMVTIYEAATGTKKGFYQAYTGAIGGLDFSPDSQSLVTSSEGQSYDMEMTPMGSGGSSTSSHEPFLAHVLEVPGARPVASLPNQARNGLGTLPIVSRIASSRSTARFSPDGTRIVTTGERQENNCLWNARTGKLIERLKGHSHSAYMAAFSPDSRRIATAGADNVAILWDAQSGERLNVLKGHEGPVLWVEFSPDSRLAVTASADGTARVWSVGRGICISVLRGHTKKVYRARFSPDGLRVATASEDGTACIWDAASMDYLSRIFKHDDVVLAMEFSEDSKHMVTRSRDGVARVWNSKSDAPLRLLKGLPEIMDDDLRSQFVDETLFARFSADASRLVTLTDEPKARVSLKPVLGFGGTEIDSPYAPLRVWNVDSGLVERAFPRADKAIASVDLSSDGRLLAAGQHDRLEFKTVFRSSSKSGSRGSQKRTDSPTSAWIWDMETGNIIHELEGHEGRILVVAFSTDNGLLVSADSSKARLWDAASGKQLCTFKKSAYVEQCVFLPDGKRVLLRSPGKVGIWSLETGDMLTRFTINGRQTDIRQCTLSPDGKLVACFTQYSNSLYLCSSASGEVVQELEGHRSEINSAAFHPSGEWLATASEDKTVNIWNTSMGTLVRTLEGHKQPVTSVIFSPDGLWLGSTSRDFTARLWPVAAF